MRVLPMGVDAVLVEDPPGGPAAWANGLRQRAKGVASPDVVDVVPAARTVLVRCADGAALGRVASGFDSVEPITADRADEVVEIPVTYDGADLHEVASAIGVAPDDVAELHAGAVFSVAFCGFAPGFGYLSGLPTQLHLPRRTSPRTSVPAGSVAIASEYSAVYPRSSPGGWHLIGRTDLTLFDVHRDPPALLRPGVTVRFRRAS